MKFPVHQASLAMHWCCVIVALWISSFFCANRLSVMFLCCCAAKICDALHTIQGDPSHQVS